MKLHCLGTAGYHPSESRHTSCYYLPECRLVLDAGTGIFRLRHLLRDETLDILLSHAHLDHVVGLTFLLDLVAMTPLKRVRVFGEHRKLEAIQSHLFSELIFPVMPPIDWISLESIGPEQRVGGAKLTWFPMVHPGGSVGYRLDWPETSLAYITDTTATDDATYWRHIQGCQTVLHECNFRDHERDFAILTGHSCTSDVLRGAVRANIARLHLIHMNPLLDEADPTGLAEHEELWRDKLVVSTMRDGDVVDLLA